MEGIYSMAVSEIYFTVKNKVALGCKTFENP